MATGGHSDLAVACRGQRMMCVWVGWGSVRQEKQRRMQKHKVQYVNSNAISSLQIDKLVWHLRVTVQVRRTARVEIGHYRVFP